MYIETTDNLPGDTFNEDGTVTLPYIHFHIQDDIYFVEDDADLTGITHTVNDGNFQDVLNEKCKEVLGWTDWYDIRKAGTGKEPPENIAAFRNKLRNLIQ